MQVGGGECAEGHSGTVGKEGAGAGEDSTRESERKENITAIEIVFQDTPRLSVRYNRPGTPPFPK